jgi:hypothetical protein
MKTGVLVTLRAVSVCILLAVLGVLGACAPPGSPSQP